MSVPKVKCPSCGTEWVGPVVFCGECGSPLKAHPSAKPGDRIARVVPEAAGASAKGASAAKPAPAADDKPDGRPATVPPPVDPARTTRPSNVEGRRTELGMPAVSMPAALSVPAAPKSAGAKPAEKRKESSSKKRKGSVVIAAEPETAEEAERLLEALDAGFESIVRPNEAPEVAITPSTVPDIPQPSPSSPSRLQTLADSPQALALVTGEVTPAADPLIEVKEAAAEVLAEVKAVQPDSLPAPSSSAAASDEAARRAQHEADMAEVRALFTEMAVAHARPLRDFMIEVSWGEPTREWLDVAIPASAALRRAADALEMPDLGVALDGFSAALELCAGEPAFGREGKDLLLGAYAKLAEMMPAAFALEGERGRREPIIVRSLLLQVPGVQKVSLDKIYAAGLTSLEMLYAAGPADLAETTGLDREVCARIHDRFQRYRQEVAGLDPGKDRAAERAELSARLIELSAAHEEHERLSRQWTADAAAGRVKARKDRNDALLAVHVLLARMGEVDRLKALERAPFAQKIRDLQAFLDEAKRRSARP